MISVVIPAYNESAVIKRALNGITNGAHSGEIDVIVVCNGCTDDTAQQARQIEYPVRVIETMTGSKTHALNLGDAAAGTIFPRVYMDADVVMNVGDLRALTNRLARGDILAGVPTPRVVVDRCGLLARWYYDVALLLPSASDGFGASGVYALSREGRQRFGRFPNVIADDMYVRAHFKAHECETVVAAVSTVFRPAKLRDILRVNIRVKRGNRQVTRALPQGSIDRLRNHTAILALFGRFSLWPKLFLYCALTVTAELAARWPAGRRGYRWLRDDSTRMSPPVRITTPS